MADSTTPARRNVDVPEGHWILAEHWQLCVVIAVTTAAWVTVTLLTPPANEETLKKFVRKTRPGGPGWKHIEDRIVAEGGHRVKARLGLKILCLFLGCFAIWGSLFCLGRLLYGRPAEAAVFGVVAAVSMFLIFKVWGAISGGDE